MASRVHNSAPATLATSAVLCFAAISAFAQSECEVAELIVGEGRGKPTETVQVELLGGVSCDVTGFSLAIGHDNERIRFVDAVPGSEVVDHARDELFLSVDARNEEGFVVLVVIFDLFPPLVIEPRSFEPGTVLMTLEYEILDRVKTTESPLLNRTLTYGENPVSNVFSSVPGQAPIEPRLEDGVIFVDGPPEFIRGDVDGGGDSNLSDAVFGLRYLFQRGPAPPCLEAADVNGSGMISISDSVYLLLHLFRAGSPPPAPYPDCDVSPETERVGCDLQGCP